MGQKRRRHWCPVKFVEYGPLQPTRYPGLNYQRQGPANWRFVVVHADDGNREAAVGPCHPSKETLLADLDRYAKSYGY